MQQDNENDILKLHFLEKIFQNIEAGLIVEDQDRRILMVNQKFCEIFQIPVNPDNLIGTDCRKDLIRSAQAFKESEAFIESVNDTLARKELRIGEQWTLKDGRVLERDYVPVFLDSEYKGHLWHYKDISHRTLAEKRIRERESQLRSLYETQSFFIGLAEPVEDDILFLYCNQATSSLADSKAEPVGLKFMSEVGIPRENIQLWLAQCIRSKLSRTPVEFEYNYMNEERERWVSVTLNYSSESVSESDRFSFIGHDITRKKEVEKELIHQKEKAEEASRVKSQFLSTMSHEIRTPMNAVIGMTHLLLESEPREDQVENLQILRFASESLMELINDILDLSKIEAGKLELQEDQLDLLELSKNVCTSFSQKLDEKPLHLQLTVNKTLPNVQADSQRLRQIMTNLLSNAIKFTEEGEVQFQIELLEETEKEIEVCISVSDTGIGIPRDKIHSLFESFSQIQMEDNRTIPGTGLGLAISQSLARLMGSKILVESQEGAGSRFHFSLKLKKSDYDSKKKCGRKQTPKSLLPLEGTRVLLVEDNLMNIHVASRFLKKWKVDVSVAEDGMTALKLVEQNDFDLVLMDLQMPILDGFETTMKIREMPPPKRNIPVIALTAAAISEIQEQLHRARMNDCILKPFDPMQLYQKIKYFSSRGKTFTPS